MRVAFLPVVVLLAGGVAWGQSAVGMTGAPPELRARSEAPLAVQTAKPSSALLALQEQKSLTLALEQKALKEQHQALARLTAERNGTRRASGPEPIPTQWPHAKLEPIPTQWKAKVILVGGAAGQHAAKTAGATVVPK